MPPYKNSPPLKRFYERFIPEPNSGCWLWDAWVSESGYGFLSVNGRLKRAHVFSYETFKGEIPKGLCVLHSCDIRCCVNPDHLHLGTRQDNSREAKERNRYLLGEKHFATVLSEADIKAIRQDTRTQRQIANDFGVGQMTISNIKRRVTWGHVK